MKTKLIPFFIGLSLFIFLVIITKFINQDLIVNKYNIATISVLMLILLMFLAGVIDGFNPCAFSTLLIWVGFLINNFGKQIDDNIDIKKKRKTIHSFAIFYSLGIFTIYILIGATFLVVGDIISPVYIPLITRLAGLIIVILGLLMIRDSFSSKKNPIIKMPKFLYPLVKKYSKPTTKIASFVSGVVIGLCTIPCSGAIYMGAIAIINSQPIHIKYPSILIYNIGFILPVVILAITISNRKVLTHLSQDFLKNKLLIKRIIGFITILLGIISIYLV